MHCPACGAPYAQTALFCPGCGALVRVTEDVRVPAGAVPRATPLGEDFTVIQHHVLPEPRRRRHPGGLVAAAALVVAVAALGLWFLQQSNRPERDAPAFASAAEAVSFLAAHGIDCPAGDRLGPLARVCGAGFTVTVWPSPDDARREAEGLASTGPAGRSALIVVGNLVVRAGPVRADKTMAALAAYGPYRIG